jgi:hypothetical protein
VGELRREADYYIRKHRAPFVPYEDGGMVYADQRHHAAKNLLEAGRDFGRTCEPSVVYIECRKKQRVFLNGSALLLVQNDH